MYGTATAPRELAHSLLKKKKSILVSVSDFMALSTVFHSVNFSDKLTAFSLCSSSLTSAVLFLSTIYLFMTVSLSLWLTELKAPTN